MLFSVFSRGALIITAALLFLPAFLYAQSASEAYRTEIFRNLDGADVTISTSGGFIDVQGHDENSVRVEMFVKRGRTYLMPSDTDLEGFEINISQSGNMITASAERESSGWNWFGSGDTPSVSFRLMVPLNAVVDGRTSGGAVKAANLQNDTNLRTSGGSMILESASGNINLRTSGGAIRITDVSGTIGARTSGGAISVENARGALDVRTSGGGIRIAGASGSVEARTSGGNIRAEMLELREKLDLRTSGGNIIIDLPGPAPYDLDLRGGRVNIDLVDFTGNSSRDRINGSMMGGGTAINARTSGGNVTVNMR